MPAEKIWPLFEAPAITASSSELYDLPCPYILSKKKLGTGLYADVYECKNTITGGHFAAKRFKKKLVYGLELMLQTEFQVLKAVLREHKNILSMIDYFETSEYFYLVTDLANGGELFERITQSPNDRLTIADTRSILVNLLSALAHLHRNGIVHRDIKAENILFASRNSRASLLLLADFGHAQILTGGEMALTFGGTLSYLAPEVVNRVGHSFPVDIWAVGVLTYFMLCGYMPFDCDTDAETKQYIKTADYVYEPEEYWSDIPADAKDFIDNCLRVNPDERITAEESLKHPFLAENLSSPSTYGPAISSTSLQALHDAVWKLHNSRQHSSANLLKTASSTNLSKNYSTSNLARASYTSIPKVLAASMSKLSSKNLVSLRGDSNSASLSSRQSHDNCVALLGGKCYSPETVTAFTTPVTSGPNSRQQSHTNLHNLHIKPHAAPAVTTGVRAGNANFMI